MNPRDKGRFEMVEIDHEGRTEITYHHNREDAFTDANYALQYDAMIVKIYNQGILIKTLRR